MHRSLTNGRGMGNSERGPSQTHLWPDEVVAEDPDFLTRQLITYIGSKRSLLTLIGDAVGRVKARLGKEKLRVFDAFCGSGVVSRFFKAHASLVISNDLEDYAAITARCYLQNRSNVDLDELARICSELNGRVDSERLPIGFIEEMYSPKDENQIVKEDRVFYTRSNARRLDNYRRLIDAYSLPFRDLLLGPLLSKASIHANTSGVFKGFYKNRHAQVGQFGGTGGDALLRILGTIEMEPPNLSRFQGDFEVFQEDANGLAPKLPVLDLAYIDPPYNQHPYGSNYFMLNLLVHYRRPERVSRVSGIPNDWRRSGYNVRAQSMPLLRELLESIDAPYLLVSYNNEGFISPAQMRTMLSELGSVEVFEKLHNAFRGSRSFANRSIHVTEQLFLVERK